MIFYFEPTHVFITKTEKLLIRKANESRYIGEIDVETQCDKEEAHFIFTTPNQQKRLTISYYPATHSIEFHDSTYHDNSNNLNDIVDKLFELLVKQGD